MTSPNYGAPIVRMNLDLGDLNDLVIVAPVAGDILVYDGANWRNRTVTGDITVSATGVVAIAPGVIVDADISATAEIQVSKLADGAARQLLQTAADGVTVEWTDNVDIPGTLDVTGVATFDTHIILAEGSAPVGTLVYLARDNVGDLTLNALVGKTINLAIAGTDVARMSATALAFQQATIISTSTGDITLIAAGGQVIINPTVSTTGGISQLQVRGDITATAGTSNQRFIGAGGSFGGSVTLNSTNTHGRVATVELFEPNITLAGGSLVTRAYTLYIADQPDEGGTANAALGFAAGLVIFGEGALTVQTATGNLLLDPGGLLVLGAGKVFQSAGAAEIGIAVTNAALTVGSLGSIVVPVKTDAGAPNDAAFGNLNGAFGFNSNDNTLEVRDGVDTFLSVGVAGYVVQRRAPVLASLDGWYHPMQYVGTKVVDETRCVVCGSEMLPGDQVSLWANGRVRNDDLHAIFGHLHLEREPRFSSLEERVAVLVEANEILMTQVAALGGRVN